MSKRPYCYCEKANGRPSKPRCFNCPLDTMTSDSHTGPVRLNKHQRALLVKVAALGPEGGAILRCPLHSELEALGLIETSNVWACVTGEGLDALSD